MKRWLLIVTPLLLLLAACHFDSLLTIEVNMGERTATTQVTSRPSDLSFLDQLLKDLR